jgi:hypothetical protein
MSPKEEEKEEVERQKKVLQILEQLVQTDAFDHIQDASAWQREIRADRPLPHQE